MFQLNIQVTDSRLTFLHLVAFDMFDVLFQHKTTHHICVRLYYCHLFEYCKCIWNRLWEIDCNELTMSCNWHRTISRNMQFVVNVIEILNKNYKFWRKKWKKNKKKNATTFNREEVGHCSLNKFDFNVFLKIICTVSSALYFIYWCRLHSHI